LRCSRRTPAKVGGIGASKKPKPGKLLPLGKNGKFPASVLPGTVKGPPGAEGATGVQDPVGPPGGFGLLNLGRANVMSRSLSPDGAFSSVTAGSDGLPLVTYRRHRRCGEGRALPERLLRGLPPPPMIRRPATVLRSPST
jgi:hypothetical protein